MFQFRIEGEHPMFPLEPASQNTEPPSIEPQSPSPVPTLIENSGYDTPLEGVDKEVAHVLKEFCIFILNRFLLKQTFNLH